MTEINPKVWCQGIALGGFLALGIGAQTVGLLFTTASRSAFISGLAVVFVAILALCSGQEGRRHGTVWSVLLSVVGLYFMIKPETDTINAGDLLTFLGAGAFGVQIFLINRFSASNVYGLILSEFVTLSVVFSLAAIANRGEYVRRSPGLYVSLLFMVLLGTIAAFSLQLYFQRYGSPLRASLIYALEPLFASAVSAALLGEVLAGKEAVGGLLL